VCAAPTTPSNFRLNAHARTTVVQFVIINVSGTTALTRTIGLFIFNPRRHRSVQGVCRSVKFSNRDIATQTSESFRWTIMRVGMSNIDVEIECDALRSNRIVWTINRLKVSNDSGMVTA